MINDHGEGDQRSSWNDLIAKQLTAAQNVANTTILSLVRIRLIKAVGADSLRQIIASGDSFLAVVFHSAQPRDSALAQLQGKTVLFEGTNVSVTIHPSESTKAPGSRCG